MSNKITIGADPEFFVAEGDKLVSAHGLVKGTKQEPHPVNCGAVQVDGMALEFNIDPANNQDEFVYNINTVIACMRKLVPQKYGFKFTPVAQFGADYIAGQPEEAKELGCEPDYNAYINGMNVPPNADADFRTAAGHIHIGIDRKLSGEEQLKLVVLCDLFLGLSSLFWDDDAKRRELYGKAGCYRVKPYGIEYRTLSNAWLKSEELQRRVYNLAIKAASNIDNFVEIFNFLFEDIGFNYIELEDVINNSDKKVAREVLDTLKQYNYM